MNYKKKKKNITVKEKYSLVSYPLSSLSANPSKNTHFFSHIQHFFFIILVSVLASNWSLYLKSGTRLSSLTTSETFWGKKFLQSGQKVKKHHNGYNVTAKNIIIFFQSTNEYNNILLKHIYCKKWPRSYLVK